MKFAVPGNYFMKKLLKLNNASLTIISQIQIIDKVVNEFVLEKQTPQEQQVNNSREDKIKLYFENQMWSNNKIDEKQLTEIIKKNVKLN